MWLHQSDRTLHEQLSVFVRLEQTQSITQHVFSSCLYSLCLYLIEAIMPARNYLCMYSTTHTCILTMLAFCAYLITHALFVYLI